MADLLLHQPAAGDGMEDRTDRPGASHWFKIVLLVVGYAAFTAVCTPSGTKSGEYPEALVFTLSGAIAGHWVLFSLWAGLGPAPWFRRVPITALACVLIGFAFASGEWRRGVSPGYLANGIAMGVVLFLLYTLVLLLIRRRWGWRIVHCGVPPGYGSTREYRFQFGLRLLLLWITLAACVMALYRCHFPDGGAAEIMIQWWQRFGRRDLLGLIIITPLLLPTFIVPWVALARNRPGKRAILVIGTAWVAYGLGLIAVMTYGMRLGPWGTNVVWVVSMQFGASAASVLVALAFRSWGYRIVRLAKAETVPSATRAI